MLACQIPVVVIGQNCAFSNKVLCDTTNICGWSTQVKYTTDFAIGLKRRVHEVLNSQLNNPQLEVVLKFVPQLVCYSLLHVCSIIVMWLYLVVTCMCVLVMSLCMCDYVFSNAFNRRSGSIGTSELCREKGGAVVIRVRDHQGNFIQS